MAMHNETAEQDVIGAILLDPRVIGLARERLNPDDFFTEINRMVFQAMCDLDDSGDEISCATLCMKLFANDKFERLGGAQCLFKYTERLPSAACIERHADIVREDSKRRKLVSFAEGCKALADKPIEDIDTVISRLSDELMELSSDSISRPWVTMEEGVKEAMETILESDKKTRVLTGLVDLDAKLTNLKPGTLTIIAARPAMGKTALGVNIMCNAALRGGIPVGFFSLEMTANELIIRLICGESEVNGEAIRQQKMTDSEWSRVLSSAESLTKANIFINQTPAVDISLLKELAKRMQRTHGIRLLIVDYLQLITSSQRRIQSREQEVATISRGLKLIAKELSIPVIAMSQLNRGTDARADKKPILSDLRESGSIEQDADNVLFIHRDDYYSHENTCTAEIIIAKQRNGATGSVNLHWNGEITKFGDLEREFA